MGFDRLSRAGGHDVAAAEPEHDAADIGMLSDLLAIGQQNGNVDRRAALRAKVVRAGDRELAELDEGLATRKAELERRLADQVGRVDAEGDLQTSRLSGRLEGGEARLASDIASRSALHRKRIGAERAALEEQAAEGGAALAHDEHGLEEAADAEAQATREHARQKAEETRTAGRAQAARARLEGDDRAHEAVATVTRLAGTMPGAEVAALMPVAASRAAQARVEAEQRAAAIEARADAAARDLLADGERLAAAQVERGLRAAAEARALGESGAGRLAEQAHLAAAAMESRAAAAAERMALERGALQAGAPAARADADRAVAEAEAAARARADKERAETLVRLEKGHAQARKQVEERVAATVARIEQAGEPALARIERELRHDLQSLDGISEASDRALSAQVKGSEDRLKRAAADLARQLRLEVRRSMGALARLIADARGRVIAADRGTGKEIATAAAGGRKAIAETGDAAGLAQAAAERKALEALGVDAGAERKALDEAAARVAGELAAQAGGVGAAIDARWIADALATANAELDDEGLFNVVTDDEALRGMDVLTSLPARAQAQAVAGLGDDQLANLLEEVPEARRESLMPLAQAAARPERKLLLWREAYKSQLAGDLARDRGAEGVSDEENRRRHEQRARAAAHSAVEADEEVGFLAARPYTGGDVDRLMERKATEHELETTYNLDITNEPGARADGSKIVWTKEELEMLAASFGGLPRDDVAGNALLKELRREDVFVANGVEDPTTGGTHLKGVVTVFDYGASLDRKGLRHGGDDRELSSPTACKRCGAKITVLDMTVTHELGHDIHDQKKEAAEAYRKASGWRFFDKKGLLKAGLTRLDVLTLERTRNLLFGSRVTIHKNGKIYMVDPFDNTGFVAVDDTAIPETGESEVGAGGGDKDTWAYARISDEEQFAEHYAKAVHVPEKLYQDLVENPATAVEQGKAAVEKAEALAQQLERDGSEPEDLDKAREELAVARKAMAHARAAQAHRRKQFDIMRNDVFGTDREVDAARARLEKRGAASEEIAGFLGAAARVSTPEQVRVLEGRVP